MTSSREGIPALTFRKALSIVLIASLLATQQGSFAPEVFAAGVAAVGRLGAAPAGSGAAAAGAGVAAGRISSSDLTLLPAPRLSGALGRFVSAGEAVPETARPAGLWRAVPAGEKARVRTHRAVSYGAASSGGRRSVEAARAGEAWTGKKTGRLGRAVIASGAAAAPSGSIEGGGAALRRFFDGEGRSAGARPAAPTGRRLMSRGSAGTAGFGTRTGGDASRDAARDETRPGGRRLLATGEAGSSAPTRGPPVPGAAAAPSGVLEARPESRTWRTLDASGWRPEQTPALPTEPEGVFRASWERWTGRLTNVSVLAFLTLHLPQIVKNIGYLANGTVDPISILPWMGFAAGILGNMLLLARFVSLKERGAASVQTAGLIASGVVVVQIFLAGFMPAPAFWTIVPAIVGGLVLNYLNLTGKVNPLVWSAWKIAIGLAGLAVLPMVLWATFMPAMAYWPALVTAGGGALLLLLKRLGALPKSFDGFWGSVSAWTATLLFMFGPVAQLVSNVANPANIAGLALPTVLLAAAGNALMLPRAVLTKDRIWAVGSFWAVTVGGWGVMLSMLLNGSLSIALFCAFSAFLPLYMAFSVDQARRYHGEDSFGQTLSFLFGSGAKH
ncbi:MAG: hypothetical protein ABII00_13665 [Elusimicrobiota bacterium]